MRSSLHERPPARERRGDDAAGASAPMRQERDKDAARGRERHADERVEGGYLRLGHTHRSFCPQPRGEGEKHEKGREKVRFMSLSERIERNRTEESGGRNEPEWEGGKAGVGRASEEGGVGRSVRCPGRERRE